MGLTQKLGTIPLAISTDASNNIGIGGSPSGSYKLEVTGTAKVSSTLLVSGAATFGSTLSNGTYTYTLPSATGTLALTSALSGYLPLTGGTLTGALSGTSATFSSSVTAGSLIVNQASTAADIILKFQINGTNKWLVGLTNDVVDDNFTIYQDGAGGGNRFTINTSGNVGIGTSSPAYQFDVYAASGYTARFNGATYGGLILANAGTANSYFVGESTLLSIEHTTAINIRTNNADRMRITSAGNVGIGTSTPSGKLQIEAGVSTDSAPHILLGGNGYSGFHWMNNTAYYIGQNSQGRDVRVYSGNNTAVGVALTPNATSWTNYSDERLKTNIENFDSVLENILSLRTIKYHFKDVDEQDSQKRYGLVAQDLVGKFDEVLSKSKFSENDDTEYLGVRYTELIPVLVKAIQELNQQNQDLKSRLDKAGL